MTYEIDRCLLSDYDIKLQIVRREVIRVCVKSKLISSEDILKKTTRYCWVCEVVERNLVGISLLNQVLLEFAEVSEEFESASFEVDDMISHVLQSIAKLVLNDLPQVPNLHH